MKLSKYISAFLAFILAFSVLVPVSAFSYLQFGDWQYIINDDDTYILYRYTGTETELSLPETENGVKVVGIYDRCFSNSDIKSVQIPDSYISIGFAAFHNCEDLTSITIPSGIKTIGGMAFNSCTSLSNVDLSRNTNITEIPYAAFQGDTALKSITIPHNITKIGDNAFKNTGLTSVNIPDTVKSVGEYVFSGCESLVSVNFPADLNSIPDYAFDGCKSLNNIELTSGLTEIGNYAFNGCESMNITELPYGVSKIGESAFAECTGITELNIPDTVASIGSNAFYPMSVSETLTVHCSKNSYVETYCNQNFVKTDSYDKLLGDVDLNGDVDVDDVTCIQKYRVGVYEISGNQALAQSDVNGDGEITIRDATQIQMIILGIDV